MIVIRKRMNDPHRQNVTTTTTTNRTLILPWLVVAVLLFCGPYRSHTIDAFVILPETSLSSPSNGRLQLLRNNNNNNNMNKGSIEMYKSYNNILSPKTTRTRHTCANTTITVAANPSSSEQEQKLQQEEETTSTVVDNKDKYSILFTLVTAILAFMGLVTAGGPGAWRYYLAGGICAATSHAITTPIDVVKTRQQVDPELKDLNPLQSLKKIVKKEGIHTLLAGLGPTTFGYLAEGAVKFGVYEVLKPTVGRFLLLASTALSFPVSSSSFPWNAIVRQPLSFLNSKLINFIICGSISGIAASAMLCPMEALRIRLVAEGPKFANKGWITCGYDMIQQEGVFGMWKGMTAMMCKQVPYTVTKNVSFDLLTTLAYATVISFGYAITSHTKFVIPCIAAIAASILSCISSQPGDLLLTVVNAHGGETHKTREFANDIYKRDGIGGFFVGIQARFLHVGIIVTVQLLLYDFIKRLCGVVATGLAY